MSEPTLKNPIFSGLLQENFAAIEQNKNCVGPDGHYVAHPVRPIEVDEDILVTLLPLSLSRLLRSNFVLPLEFEVLDLLAESLC